jgi:hypothetical protein
MRELMALLMLTAPAAAQEVEVGVRLREWYARYDGAVTADGRPNNGTRLDAGSELGLDSYEFAHEIQLSVDVERVGHFSAGYWRLRLEGDDVLEGNANFDGQSFPAGAAIESKLGFDVIYLDYEYALVQGAVDVGLIAGGRYISAEADLEGGGNDEHANLNRPLLLPGVHVGAELAPWLRAEARLEGLAFSAHNVRAHWIEAEGELAAEALPGLTLGLGYRHIWTYFKAREDSLNFDLDGAIGGIYLAVGYRF